MCHFLNKTLDFSAFVHYNALEKCIICEVKMPYINKQRDKIVNYINNCIINQRLHPGDKLPAENSLAETLGVSRVTVRRALELLEESGVIERRLNKGAFVKENSASEVKQLFIPFIAQHNQGDSRFFDLYSGVQNFFLEHNMQPMLSATGYNSVKERELILDFYQKGHKYMLIMSAFSDKNIPFYLYMMQRGVNFVFLDKYPLKITCDCVKSNNFDGAYKATQYLLSQGHKKIALLAPQSFKSATTASERFDGYKFAMMQQNLFDNELVFEAEEHFSEAEIEQILARHPEITALFVLSDYASVPILRFLNERNLKISILGFDNLKESENTTPALSTVEQSFYQIGFSGAKLLYERIVDPNKPYEVQSLPTKLIIRDSVYFLNDTDKNSK